MAKVGYFNPKTRRKKLNWKRICTVNARTMLLTIATSLLVGKKIRGMCCDGGSNLWVALQRCPKPVLDNSRRCVGHLLQGVGKAVWNTVVSVKNCIANAKGCAEYIKRSAPMRQKLDQIQIHQGSHPYKLKQHTKVRWDSEFDLLDHCNLMKAALLELYQDPEYEGQRIMANDWNTVPKALKCL